MYQKINWLLGINLIKLDNFDDGVQLMTLGLKYFISTYKNYKYDFHHVG
jgi:hypothetical protein